MRNAMDDFVAKLQEQIFDETEATYGKELFSRWQNPRFMGKMSDPSSVAQISGESVLKALGGLPEEEKHCAFLAAEALMGAIHQWIVARTSTAKP